MVRLEARLAPKKTSAARLAPEALGLAVLRLAAAPEAQPLPEAVPQPAEPPLEVSGGPPSEVRLPEPLPPEPPAWFLHEDELQGERAPPAWRLAPVA
jgi:hypothetical protein